MFTNLKNMSLSLEYWNINSLEDVNLRIIRNPSEACDYRRWQLLLKIMQQSWLFITLLNLFLTTNLTVLHFHPVTLDPIWSSVTQGKIKVSCMFLETIATLNLTNWWLKYILPDPADISKFISIIYIYRYIQRDYSKHLPHHNSSRQI